ncbi:MAG: CoA-binding protein [Deltaproteobacteria bacterium]|nr:CoA-binding protein [Deltaproteobacteria bacterium]
MLSVDLKGLDKVFNPASVAVVGASSTMAKWGQMILTNIVAGRYAGKVFPVNVGGGTLCGLTTYKSIQDVPEPVDLAIVATPAETLPQVVEGCGQRGVKGMVVVTSGFGETGEKGKSLEKQIVSSCEERGMILVGPNTMGILCTHAGLFATGTHARPRKGSVAFISQSGNLGNQLIHWADQQGIGISLFVGSGNEAMITCNEYLEYLERDPHTGTIILYVESIREGARFLDISRRINRTKPVIVLKGGRTEAGKGASASHTGAMSGEATTFTAACRQAGILEVSVPSELLDLSAGFSSLPLPQGNRVGIVTLGGGWGVVTADQCNEKGLVVPDIPDRIVESIGRHLPPFWSRRNPVDLVGTRDPEAPLVAVEELLRWDGIDAVISLGIVGRHELGQLLLRSTREVEPSMSPHFLSQMETLLREYEEGYISRMAEFMEAYGKPVIGVTMARTEGGVVRRVDGKRHNPVFFQTPEDAVSVLAGMVRYYRFRSGQ